MKPIEQFIPLSAALAISLATIMLAVGETAIFLFLIGYVLVMVLFSKLRWPL